MLRRIKISLAWMLGVLIFVNVALAVITNVKTNVTAEDARVFQRSLGLQRPAKDLSFDEQIKLIKYYQFVLAKTVPFGKPIPDYQSREPMDLLNAGTGLCYDRSRSLDKMFRWAGFESRHVYIIYLEHPVTGEKISVLRALLTRGSASHAVTEVKTKKGWLTVDSILNWVSLTRNGDPVEAGEVRARQNEIDNVPSYFKKDYFAIPGMYSRRGQLYRPYILYPEFHWPDFLSWLVGLES